MAATMSDPSVVTADVGLAVRSDNAMDLGLSCQPADRAAAVEAVFEAYAMAGQPDPTRVYWCDSPAAGAMTVAALGVETTGISLKPLLRTRPWGLARAAELRRLGGVGFARHWAVAAARPWRQLMDQLVTPIRTRLERELTAAENQLSGAARIALLDVMFGQHDAAWLAAFDQQSHPQLGPLTRLAESCGWWWGFERVIVLTDRPSALHRDNLGRLHHDAGPAVAWRDGTGMHAWGGMPIPRDVADRLPRLTVEEIRTESNAEIRRVLLEYFGFERYLRESGARHLQSDEFGVLWRMDMPADEPVVMVEVHNATPEPDGTVRTYFLRVPPTIRTARAGVAWTFGLGEQTYAPLRQT